MEVPGATKEAPSQTTEAPVVTVSAAVQEHLRQLCLHEFPCGAGSWVR